MPWESKEANRKLVRSGGEILVPIPKEFVLVGDDVLVRQDKDGAITIHPATKEGWDALADFHPLAD